MMMMMMMMMIAQVHSHGTTSSMQVLGLLTKLLLICNALTATQGNTDQPEGRSLRKEELSESL
eukprot:500211-Karenia_brevis.AAC.1